ncbi:putative membrane protein [Erythrobacter litoralis]|uniref:DUF2254 domain-containing protein n=1 Tax=Erythrobacter litoralis TaxID=39960 RepID=A0A074MIB3_9SPHN|nr:DUF2254 domain-containing protein [Erythrobacter litoralis]AOL24536.1 putative membrane protein [Erythrobacter litoralis]KEO93224.1 hypothetical protein EH32_10900 [Erythrobacter litoralis]MEE4337551.1 DUF2254 domain-containing protein [Erythrobacter sp.]
MTAEIRFFWARLNANYWFYPALFAILAGVLGFLLVWADRAGASDYLAGVSWLVPVGPKGASDILSVMASSTIAIASTVFSITLVAVTYASGTYGPRLLTNFLEDRGNQLSLATFIGSFVYALVVLRSVRAADEAALVGAGNGTAGFAPQLSLLVAYALMGLSVAVLVFFLNHVPSSIRINMVLEKIGKRLIRLIRKTYPIENEFSDAQEAQGGDPLESGGTGYVQLIDFSDLETLARDVGATFSLRVRTGDFVHTGLPLLDVSGCPVDRIAERAREAFTFGSVRTPEQDPQFLIDELVEIGLRALSPGINDPFTAITALHWLGAATSEIARRDLRKDVCESDADDCPVIPLPDDFAHYVSRGFGAMRSAVATSPVACLVMLDVLADAAKPIGHDGRIAQLRSQGMMLGAQARLALDGPDLEMVEARLEVFERRFWN